MNELSIDWLIDWRRPTWYARPTKPNFSIFAQWNRLSVIKRKNRNIFCLDRKFSSIASYCLQGIFQSYQNPPVKLCVISKVKSLPYARTVYLRKPKPWGWPLKWIMTVFLHVVTAKVLSNFHCGDTTDFDFGLANGFSKVKKNFFTKISLQRQT